MSILQRLLQKHTEKEIVLAFLGDSVTQGCFELYKNEEGKICTVTKPDHAFSQLLLTRLRALYPAVPFQVVNAGISGDRAPHGAKRLARDVLSHRPDLTVVCYGLNDCNAEEDGVEKYVAALEHIFTALKKSGSEVIFMTPNRMNDYVSPALTDPDMREIAAKKAALQNGGYLTKYIENATTLARKMNIPVCDCYARWCEMHESGTDTTAQLSNLINHPTREGHALFAKELLRTLSEPDSNETKI